MKIELLRDLVAFLIAIVIAEFYHWETTDLIWGIWICSTIFGGITLLACFLPHFQWNKRYLDEFLGLFFAFCIFQSIHCFALNEFFPLIDFGNGFPNIVKVAYKALILYWPLVLTTFVSRWSLFLFLTFSIRKKTHKKCLSNKPKIATAFYEIIRMHLMILTFGFLFEFGAATQLISYLILVFFFIPLENLGKPKGNSRN